MIRLECTKGGHNKFYELHLIKNNGCVIAKALYGAIGNAPQENVFYNGDNEQEAVAEMQKKQLEKVKKGYVTVGSNGKSTQTPAETKKAECPIIWPMNALGTKHQDRLDWLMANNSYVAQEKLDGMRAVVQVTRGGLRIFSRSAGINDPTRPLERTPALPHLAGLQFPGMDGVVLDAEILARGVDSAQLSGNIHRNEVTDENHKVRIFVFDVLRYGARDLTNQTLRQRIAFLDQLKPHLQSPSIEFLPWAFGVVAKKKLYHDVLERRGEGIMLKNLDEIYYEGARPSNNWYKAKKSITIDAVVMGFTQGKGKFNSRVGAVKFGQYVKGRLVELGQVSGMRDAVRVEMSTNPRKYIGRVIVIKGMERLKSGAIRYPQFGGMRQDKDPKQCKWYQNEQ